MIAIPEQRREPRIELDEDFGQLDPETGAHLTWPNLEISSILNLSRSGAAVARPGLFELNTTAQIELEIHLGRELPFAVQARCVWRTIDKAGLEFSPLGAAAHLALGEFLQYRLIGAQLRPVAAKFFSRQNSFNFWLQGSGQTHVFVWCPADIVTRVQIELGSERCTLERGQALRGGTLERRARLILSQMDKVGLNMKDFVRSLQAGDSLS